MSAKQTIFAVAALFSLMLSTTVFAGHQHPSKHRQHHDHHQSKYKHSEHDRSEYRHSKFQHSTFKHSKYAHKHSYYGTEHRPTGHASNYYKHPGYKLYLSGKHHHHGERHVIYARDRHEHDRHIHDRRELYGLVAGAIVLNEVLHHARH